jgi:hypothetical protein
MLRVLIAALVGSILAVWVGVSVAHEEYLLASLTVAISGWAVLSWRGGPYPEAWLIAVGLFGNIIGNRGFAQFSFTSDLPLLPAEAALLVGLVATMIRMAKRQTTAIRRDALNFAIIAWILIGAARLWSDVRVYGVVALRDFATVYYALLFFVAQALAQHAPSARLLRNSLLAAVAVLPVIFVVYRQIPDIIVQGLLVRGTPLIYYKDDLVAAYLFAGFFLLMTVPAWPAILRNGIATAAYATAFTINSSRAAIVGLGVTSIWWALARRWQPIRLQLILAPIAFTGLLLLAFVSGEDFKRSRVYALYEHVASMADLGGTGRYSTAEREYVGDNNRFRVFWWRMVAEETWEAGPVFGLGFGANLSERFQRNYELDLGEKFTARSPHSIIVTVLGRMGIVGLLAFGAIVVAMISRTLQLVRAARDGDAALVSLGWWSASWMLFVSACFGVVLEGPMGAFVFWAALGLGNVTLPQTALKTVPTSDDLESLPSPALQREVQTAGE